MTLKSKSIFLSTLTLLLASVSFVFYYQYKSINNDLINSAVLLSEIQNAAHELDVQIMRNQFDVPFFKQSISRIPDISRLLQERLHIDHPPQELIELEISFVRIERILNRSLAKHIPASPLLKQIHRETTKIHIAAEKLLNISRKQSDKLKYKADLLFFIQGLALILYICGVLLFLLQDIIKPLLKLIDQVNKVDKGKKQNIDITDRKDEIGILHKFISKTISGLISRSDQLKQSRENLQSQYHQQLAFAKTLKLSIDTETMEELLDETLKLVLSLKWLKIQEKGGIFLVNTGGKPDLVLKSSHNFDPAIKAKCSSVPFGKCLCGRVALSKTFLHTEDVDYRHEIKYEEMVPHGHYCIPIKFGNALMGVMVLYLEQGQKSHPNEIEFLGNIAIILAQSIKRRLLEEKQILVSTAVDHAGEGVIITDDKGDIQYVNPRITSLTGYPRKDLLYSNISKLKILDDTGIYKQITQHLSNHEVWEGTTTNIKQDNSNYDERVVVTAIKNKQNEITNLVAIKRDITKEKLLETKLLHSQKLEAVGTLAGGVAHDFNNILTYIIGYSEIILSELPKDDPNRKNLEIILSAGEKASTLVNQLMVFSRKQNLNMESLDLNVIVLNVYKMLDRLLEENVTLKIKTEKELGEILADEGQVEQILANLVINARDAMPQGGTLTIKTSKVSIGEEQSKKNDQLLPGDYARLSVSDTGEGIPHNIQNHIFEPFFTTKETGEGTGLGLASIYGIVSQHKAHIDFYSEPQNGASFQILFPILKRKNINKPDSTVKSIEALPRGTEMILLVDDEPLVRKVIQDTLKPLGYKIMAAAHAKEALDLSAAWPSKIDLLITDIVMPGINGVELANSIRSSRPDTKVILMSGYPNKKPGIPETMPPGYTFLKKPIIPSKLTAEIRSILA